MQEECWYVSLFAVLVCVATEGSGAYRGHGCGFESGPRSAAAWPLVLSVCSDSAASHPQKG